MLSDVLTTRIIRAAAEMDAAVREMREAREAAQRLPAARAYLRATVRVLRACEASTPAPTRARAYVAVMAAADDARRAGMDEAEYARTIGGDLPFPVDFSIPRALRAYRISRPERRAQMIRALAALCRWCATERLDLTAARVAGAVESSATVRAAKLERSADAPPTRRVRLPG